MLGIKAAVDFSSSLHFLQAIVALPQAIEIHRCRNLVSLASLPELYPDLEYRVSAACGRVGDADGRRAITGLTRLRPAYVKVRKYV